MTSATLSPSSSDRELDLVQIEDGGATISNIQPGSPLLAVTTGPLWDTVLHVQSSFPTFTRDGSAFHVGGGILVSAAHNFHDREGPSWSDCTSTLVFKDGAWHTITQWAAFEEFKEDADPSYDFAFCIVPSLRNFAAALEMTDGRSGAQNRVGVVAGFPKEHGYNGEKLYSARGRYSISGDKLFFDHKSSTLQGTSGGPLLNANGVAIGVHTTGDTSNRATTLFPNLIKLIKRAIATGAVVN